jgi:anti-sigma B factor antagonist
MARFEVRTSAAQPDRLVVALAGECDLAVREELRSALLAAVGRARLVVVDLRELEFLDSSGVHSLIAAHHDALERGGRLQVVNAGGVVADVLTVTGVGELLGPAADGIDHHG